MRLQIGFEQESLDRWFGINFANLVRDWIAGSALDRIGGYSLRSAFVSPDLDSSRNRFFGFALPSRFRMRLAGLVTMVLHKFCKICFGQNLQV